MSYWKKRQEELYRQLEKDEERLKKRLSSIYSRESKRLENQVASYYTKYGENNVIEYRKMMEKLDNDDIRLLMEQMDEFAKKYPQYAHLMPVRESIYKLNRLEGLQTSIKMQQLEIGAIDNEELEKHLTKNAHRAVNATAEALGFGKNFYSIESNVVKNFVGVNWSNDKNFSDRIWGNTEKLANYLSTDVAQGFARGDSYQRIMNQMKERFENVSRNDMYRLLYTEGTYVMAEATIKPFEEDFEEYKISTAGDSKVCPVCRKVSEKVFKISERKAGVNFPPFHAWCRCSFVPHVEDWDKWMDEYVEKHEKNEIETVKIKQSFLNEREESPRKMKEGDYAVDWSIIQSDEYESRLSKLSENKKVIQSIKTRCKWMLNNKDGLNTEEMYAIDLDSGKEIARITNQNLPFGIKRDDTFTARLNEADKQNVRILLMHNHPRGMPPSIEDINELFKNQNVCGITIGHDGSLYYYTKPNNKIDSSEYWVASKKYSRYNEYTGIEKAIEDLSKKYDFTFKIL